MNSLFNSVHKVPKANGQVLRLDGGWARGYWDGPKLRCPSWNDGHTVGKLCGERGQWREGEERRGQCRGKICSLALTSEESLFDINNYLMTTPELFD